MYRSRIPAATMREAFEGRNVDELREIAKLFPGRRCPARKGEIVDLLLAQFAPARLPDLLERLDELSLVALAEAAHGEPYLDLESFAARYGRLPAFETKDARGSRRVPTLLGALFARDGALPGDLARELRKLLPEPAAPEIETLDGLPESVEIREHTWDDEAEPVYEDVPLAVRVTEATARAEFLAVLRLVETERLPVGGKTRRPGKAAIEKVSAVLSAEDFFAEEDDLAPDERAGPVRAFAWPLLLQAAGFAKVSGGKLALTRPGRQALLAPPEEGLARGFEKWLSFSSFDEFSRVEVIKGQTKKGPRGLTAVADRRAAITETLAEVPPGRWVEIPELFRFLRARESGLTVSRFPWALYISEPRYGSLGYDGSHGFEILEGRYTKALLLEYFATLGVVDVAYVHPTVAESDFHDMWGTDELPFLSRYDGLTHIRITPFGARCLGIDPDAGAAPPPREVAVLPTFDIVYRSRPVPPEDRTVLDHFAERTSEGVWRLSRERLLVVAEEGHDPARLEAFLREASAAPLPETVARLFAETSERARALSFAGTVLLVDCRDEAVAELLANDPGTRGLCVRAGARGLVVRPGDERRFRTAARKLGYPIPAAPLG